MFSWESILLSISFLFLMLMSFYGTGILAHSFFLSKAAQTFGQSCLLGFTLFLSYSSYLEMLRWGSPQAFFVFIGVGVVGLISHRTKCVEDFNQLKALFRFSHLQKSRFTFLYPIVLLVLIIYCFLYFLNLIFLPFNFGDDYQSYAVFPVRILVEGFQGGDPFNLRGIEHGLGAGNSLNAFFLSGAHLPHLHLSEAGIGFLLLLVLILGHLSQHHKQGWVALAGFAIVCIFAIFPQQTNVTPILSGCAVALGILLLGYTSFASPSVRISICLGIYLGTLASLKGNLLIPACVFGAVIVLARWWQIRQIWVFQDALITLSSAMVFLIPWMVASFYSHGTLFYPILGKGFSNSDGFGIVSLAEYQNAVGEFLPLYGLMLSIWLLVYVHSADRRLRVFTSVLVFCVIGSTLLIAITPAGMFRYNFVILATPSAFLLTLYLGQATLNMPKRALVSTALWLRALLIIAVLASGIMMTLETKRLGRHFFNDGLYKRLLTVNSQVLEDKDFRSPNFPLEQERHQKLQNAVPAGEILLTQVNAPLLLNFKRNPILIMDYPGSVGPKPGFPFNADAEVIAQYLRDQNIRYLAHSYKDWESHRFDPYFINYCLNASGQWGRTMATRQLHVNEKMLELAYRYESHFDNGKDRIIDLAQPLTREK
jgi:hypothetical protein